MPDLAAAVRARIAAALLPPGGAPTRLGAVDLLPHQREAAALVRASLESHGGAVLADPVGTGKTYVALAVAASYPGVTIVAPAALRTMWHRALEKAGQTAAVASIESLHRRAPSPAPANGLVVVDEAHHARNPATRRYDALARLTWGRDVLLLTATPIHNRPRDLRALCALFLGESAATAPVDVLARVLCRRIDALPALRLPRVTPMRWLEPAGDAGTLRRIMALPPPVPPRDGTVVNALGTLGLARQWCSSDTALLAALDRRLTTACALEARLAQGAHLTRGELRHWVADTGVVQLALPMDTPGDDHVPPGLAAQLREHIDGVRALRDHLEARGQPDGERFSLVEGVVTRHLPARLILFSHSVDTALACYRGLAARHRCALLAGRLTKVASGTVTRDEIVRRFAPTAADRARDDAMRIDILIATDVLSEGVDLHDAGVLVHLDLPWTVARLEQRLGRLRRLGATHEEVVQYAFRPPRDGDRIVAVLRRLASKAGITRRQLGIDPAGFGFPAQVTRERRHDVAESPADAADRLRHLVRPWATCGAGASADRDALVAAVASKGSTPAFIAVLDTGLGDVVLGGMEQAVTTDPSALADLCARCGSDQVPVPNTLLHLTTHRLFDWCRLQGTRSTLIGCGTSDAHRKVLRRLAAASRGRGRSAARGLHGELGALRAMVMRSVGAGAERFLGEWLRSTDGASPTPAALQELRAALEPRVRPGAVPRQDWHLAALLLLVPQR